MNKKEPNQYLQILIKGTTLLQEGEVDRRLFLLQEGALDILIRGKKINTVDAKRGQDFVGEIGAVLGTQRTATVVAATKCVVLCLPHIEIETVIKKSPDLGAKLIRSLCRKLFNSASTLAEFQVKEGVIAGSGDTGISLRNYAKGLLYLMEQSTPDASSDAMEILQDYFLKTNPWRIQHGESGCLLPHGTHHHE